MQSIIAHQRYQATAGVEVRPLLSLFPLRFGLITLFFLFLDIYLFSPIDDDFRAKECTID